MNAGQFNINNRAVLQGCSDAYAEDRKVNDVEAGARILGGQVLQARGFVRQGNAQGLHRVLLLMSTCRQVKY